MKVIRQGVIDPTTVKDVFTGGEILTDQTPSNNAVTFTFSSPVDLIWVMTTGVEGRADPFGGTPTNTSGIRLLADTPTPIAFHTSTLKVYAASGAVSVYGVRY